MTSTAVAATGHSEPDYIHNKSGLMSWLTTVDHKRIGIMYLLAVGLFFTVGILFAVTFRLELFSPGQQFFSNGVYNRLLTTHAVIMIFLFIIPGIPAIFGNFLLPIMIGANDVSFPRLNLMSWYLFMTGALLAVVSVIMGGPDTGWTFYVPYSALTEGRVVLPITAVFILGWSSILTGLNFVTTVHRLRAPSMPWFKMPLFVWAIYATSWIQVIATPVVGITLLLVLMERFMGIGIFDPTKGGDPVLYQHLFWIYSHPAVYIMILPAMGVASEIIPVFCRKTIFGYKFIAASSIAIAAIGSLVWAHHMFTSGIADYARILFSLLTFLVAIPSAVKVFNWMATMYKGSIRMETPFILTVIFIILFAIGGFTGLTHGALSTDIHLHDTSYVVAHFHYTMLGGGGVMFFAALHYWFPLMFGKMYNTKVANLGVALFFIGFNMVYIPLFVAGMYGMPRRYATYLPEYTIWHRTSTVGSWFLAAGLILMLVNILWAAKKGQKSAPNPWKGLTLEWTVPMPPPEFQFKDVPVVTHGPYEYATGASHE